MAARAENSGALFNAGRTSLMRLGHAPILMQPVGAILSLPGPGRYTVWPLAENGVRRRALPGHNGPMPLGTRPALWYEVLRQSSPPHPVAAHGSASGTAIELDSARLLRKKASDW
jgi:hypothetical protein